MAADRNRRGRRLIAARAAAAALLLSPAACATGPAAPRTEAPAAPVVRRIDRPPSPLVDAGAIPGALAAFGGACRAAGLRPDASGLTRPGDWAAACAALAGGAPRDARAFLDRHFRAVRLGDGMGLVTGYYEPHVRAFLHPAPGLVPVLGPPDGLSCTDPARPCPARAEIEAGALSGRAPVLAWADPADLFFLQIQGSGTLQLSDGRRLPVGFAGHNGHPYVGIGQLLRARGRLPEGAGMAEIRAWLAANPEAGRALMRENPRYVFLAARGPGGPVGTLGVPLAPLGAAAVDPAHVPLGALVWLETEVAGAPWRGLLLAADTGAAIRGANRIDLFAGSGEAAGAIAGPLQARGRVTILVPREAGRGPSR